jgi:hypothetical protein
MANRRAASVGAPNCGPLAQGSLVPIRFILLALVFKRICVRNDASAARTLSLVSSDGCGIMSATFQLGPVPWVRSRLIITRWISLPPMVRLARLKHSASSQSLLLVGIICGNCYYVPFFLFESVVDCSQQMPALSFFASHECMRLALPRNGRHARAM